MITHDLGEVEDVTVRYYQISNPDVTGVRVSCEQTLYRGKYLRNS